MLDYSWQDRLSGKIQFQNSQGVILGDTLDDTLDDTLIENFSYQSLNTLLKKNASLNPSVPGSNHNGIDKYYPPNRHKQDLEVK